MAKVHIDTNVFLDFYQAATDRLKLFSELVQRANKVVLAEQTIREFRRNRTARLVELANNIESKSTIQLYTTSVVRELPQFEELVKARDTAKSLAKEMANQLRGWAHDETSDPVLAEFNKLVNNSIVYETNDELIAKAHRRKILGEPPTTPSKHTIGDELIWETLLENCKDDLVLVSRDSTFIDNANLLKNEFDLPGTRRLVLVTKNLGDALNEVGEPSVQVSEVEKEIQAKQTPNPAIESGVCPKCGGNLEETGFEGSDGDDAWWMFCTKCGHEEFP